MRIENEQVVVDLDNGTTRVLLNREETLGVLFLLQRDREGFVEFMRKEERGQSLD